MPELGAAGADGRVRLGAIGLGRWGRVMAAAYAGSAVVELRSCFTRSPQRRQAFATDFGCDADDSLEALLGRADIDAVVITVPNDQHAPVIEAAAAHGKHVYVEKPLAVEPHDMRRIRAAVEGAGLIFACGHSARRLAGVREMKRRLESGEVGIASMVEAVFDNERGRDLKPGDWRGDPRQCPGGPLTQLGIHQIDNLQYLLGPVRQVTVVGRAPLPAIPNHLVVGALLEFDDAIGYLGSNWLTPGAFTIDLYGSLARLRYELDFSWWSKSAISDAHSRLVRVTVGQDASDPDGRILRQEEVPLQPRDHLREEIEEFGRAVRGTAAVEVGLDAATANVAVVLAAARSIETGRAVPVDSVAAELR
ncbi:MAG TPA: Gfo/Idh/MocA family oxidoreductase [Candidatus Dormibacteraeota bacterium]|nr:Gfo/Idh/MocA family oxidoreductase [Candidatus Dormibacteraeota bacterium]